MVIDMTNRKGNTKTKEHRSEINGAMVAIKRVKNGALWKELGHFCVDRGISKTLAIETAINQFLDREG